MSEPASAAAPRVAAGPSDPLFRNAYALMANGGITGVLGLGYWFLAARHYEPADVGRNWAVIQAVMFVGGLTALNFMLIRFIPQTGHRTGAFVATSYAAGSGAAVVIALGFLITLDWWGPSFAHLHGFEAGLWFLVMAFAWNIFTQQDAVFTGLRRAHWVPVENTVFGLAKAVLLVAFATALPHDGVGLSWMLPVIVSLVPVNVFIFRRLIPAHARETGGRRPPPKGAEMAHYVGGDYLGGLFAHATINLIPVVVAARIDSHTNAYFTMAWVLGMMLNLLSITMAMSLTVEGAFDGTRFAVKVQASLRRTVLLLVPASALTVLLCPFALQVFGPGYAAQGAPLLQLLAAATLPKAIIEVYLGVLRVRSRTRAVAVIQGARLGGTLAVVLLVPTGSLLIGTGVGVLLVHLAIAVVVYPALRRAASPGREPTANGPRRAAPC
jgi:O-antigen/teichoic acid export membrane protein